MTKESDDLLAQALRETDPEGCDEQWSYEPQAKAIREYFAEQGLELKIVPLGPDTTKG